jgi:hypothetical protein
VIYLNAIVASVNSEPELTNLLKKTIAHEYWHMWQYKNIPNDLLEEDLKKPYRDRIMEKDAREYAWTFLIGKGEDYKSLFLNKEVKKGDVVVSKSKKSKTKKLTKEQEYQEYLDRKATFKLQQFTKEALFEIGLESNISVSKKMSKEEMAEKLVQVNKAIS